MHVDCLWSLQLQLILTFRCHTEFYHNRFTGVQLNTQLVPCPTKSTPLNVVQQIVIFKQNPIILG